MSHRKLYLNETARNWRCQKPNRDETVDNSRRQIVNETRPEPFKGCAHRFAVIKVKFMPLKALFVVLLSYGCQAHLVGVSLCQMDIA